MPEFREPVIVKTDQSPAPVYGEANGTAIWGQSRSWVGVFGRTGNAGTNGAPAGVFGLGENGSGVIGESKAWMGVYGESHGTPQSGSCGVYGVGKTGNIGVAGRSDNGIGVLGAGRLAGVFEGRVQVKGPMEVGGDVTVSGDLRLTNADGAEEFDIAEAEPVDPGTVMVLDEDGALRQSDAAYDKRVAGIVSGAGDYQPALVLDRQPQRSNRQPIALFGKVFCKVDASYGGVAIGDLLTTSPTPGHAMKADDPLKAFGAVIGKALRPLRDGQGLIPVLVALQ
jgi:hypothetical protein